MAGIIWGCTNEYFVDMSADAFYQQENNIYWIGIQGVMVDDGYADAWYWHFRERQMPTWGDDAAFYSDYYAIPMWSNWGSPPGYADPDLYDGPLPPDWTSLDMSFRLVPEPVSLVLLGIGALLLRRR